jgi:hypothetical protein
MRLYDFSAYAKKRDAAREAEQVQALVPRLNEPGAVIELKRRVEGWLVLHREVVQVLTAKG